MTEPATKSDIAAAYDEWAATYDSNPNQTRDLAAQVLRRAGLNLTGRQILEVGCGTGRNTEWLARPEAGSSNIVGLDFSIEMLAQARSRVTDARVRFIQHDIQRPWPTADASADVAIAMLILEHVEHLEPVFAEAARILRPGGELFICELHPMRQLLGGRAQFTKKDSPERQLIAAFLHDTADYVNAGLSAGLKLIHLGEWRDEEATADSPPRLLSLHFRREVL